jgi:hypothetical protein
LSPADSFTIKESNARHEKDSDHLRLAPLLFLRPQSDIVVKLFRQGTV